MPNKDTNSSDGNVPEAANVGANVPNPMPNFNDNAPAPVGNQFQNATGFPTFPTELNPLDAGSDPDVASSNLLSNSNLFFLNDYENQNEQTMGSSSDQNTRLTLDNFLTAPPVQKPKPKRKSMPKKPANPSHSDLDVSRNIGRDDGCESLSKLDQNFDGNVQNDEVMENGDGNSENEESMSAIKCDDIKQERVDDHYGDDTVATNVNEFKTEPMDFEIGEFSVQNESDESSKMPKRRKLPGLRKAAKTATTRKRKAKAGIPKIKIKVAPIMKRPRIESSDEEYSEEMSENEGESTQQETKRKRQLRQKPSKLSCPYCRRTFEKPRALYKHKKFRCLGKQLKCGKCKVQFSTHEELDDHIKSRTNNNTCSLCGRTFTRCGHLAHHRKSCSGKQFK